MKSFTVDTIHTMPDGRVTLSGPKGSIDIMRYDNSSTGQYWHTRFEQTAEENVESEVHVVSVSAITWSDDNAIGSGIQFTSCPLKTME